MQELLCTVRRDSSFFLVLIHDWISKVAYLRGVYEQLRASLCSECGPLRCGQKGLYEHVVTVTSSQIILN